MPNNRFESNPERESVPPIGTCEHAMFQIETIAARAEADRDARVEAFLPERLRELLRQDDEDSVVVDMFAHKPREDSK